MDTDFVRISRAITINPGDILESTGQFFKIIVHPDPTPRDPDLAGLVWGPVLSILLKHLRGCSCAVGI